jgi:hypothetical protein
MDDLIDEYLEDRCVKCNSIKTHINIQDLKWCKPCYNETFIVTYRTMCPTCKNIKTFALVNDGGSLRLCEKCGLTFKANKILIKK